MYPFYTMLIFWITVGIISAFIAKQKGRNVYAWFFIGLFFSLLGLALIALLPSKAEPAEPETASVTLKDAHSEAAIPQEGANPAPDKPKRLPTSPTIDWYILSEDLNPLGPFKLKHLREKFHKEKLPYDTYIWCDESDEWIQIMDYVNHSIITDSDYL